MESVLSWVFIGRSGRVPFRHVSLPVRVDGIPVCMILNLGLRYGEGPKHWNLFNILRSQRGTYIISVMILDIEYPDNLLTYTTVYNRPSGRDPY